MSVVTRKGRLRAAYQRLDTSLVSLVCYFPYKRLPFGGEVMSSVKAMQPALITGHGPFAPPHTHKLNLRFTRSPKKPTYLLCGRLVALRGVPLRNRWAAPAIRTIMSPPWLMTLSH